MKISILSGVSEGQVQEDKRKTRRKTRRKMKEEEEGDDAAAEAGDICTLDTKAQKKKKHAASIAEFEWELKKKSIDREGPIKIFLTRESIDSETVRNDKIVEQILDASDWPEREIHLYINTYGGCVLTMFAIIDALNHVPNKTKTIGIGKIMSAGGPILVSGDVRQMTRQSWLMIHDIRSVEYGSPSEMRAELEFTLILRKKLAEHLAKKSNLTTEKIEEMMDEKKNHYLSAEQALEMGFIDEIIG